MSSCERPHHPVLPGLDLVHLAHDDHVVEQVHRPGLGVEVSREALKKFKAD